MNTIKLSEHQIQIVIINYLWAKKWYPMRLNAGKMPYHYNGKNYFVNLLPPGTPDILAIKDGKCLFIEVKAAGNKPTILQTAKMKELEEYGAKCYVIHNLDELEALNL